MAATVHVHVFDGFADWEPALLMAVLRSDFGLPIRTVGTTRTTVTSMGGLAVTPDLALADLRPTADTMLVLPGGDAWSDGERPEITALLHAVAAAGGRAAGICAATLALGHAGLLDDRAHTSNGQDFLKYHLPSYRGAAHYRDQPQAVSDRGIVSAAGTAPVSFATEVVKLVAPDRAAEFASFGAQFGREHAG
jgi:putative intracellular protease/amidase